MARKNGTMLLSDFYCTKCGKKGIPVMRKQGQDREPGHLKRLFCLCCQEEINHAEIRPYGNYRYEDFLEEYELGRYYEGKKIPVAELMSCTNKECEYIKNGKCWNSNYSYKCPHRIEKTKEELNNLFEIY